MKCFEHLFPVIKIIFSTITKMLLVSGSIPRLLTWGLRMAVCVLPMVVVLPCCADSGGTNSGTNSFFPPSTNGYFGNWFARVSKTQAEQPHWITPLATVTPRLEEEFRYDQSWESLPGGNTRTSFGGGKGLEIIPAERIELIIGVPAWETQNSTPSKQGWADESFLLKYRLLSANEQQGNYILTAFMGLSVPTGSKDFTEDCYICLLYTSRCV